MLFPFQPEFVEEGPAAGTGSSLPAGSSVGGDSPQDNDPWVPATGDFANELQWSVWLAVGETWNSEQQQRGVH